MALKRRRDGAKEDRSQETGTAGVESGLLQTQENFGLNHARSEESPSILNRHATRPSILQFPELLELPPPSPVNFLREPVRLLQASL